VLENKAVVLYNLQRVINMFENDYIMRMIKQLTGCIARIMKLKSQDAEQAEKEIEDAYKQLLGINPDLLYILPVENIVSLLNRYGGNWHKIIAAANLLLEDADAKGCNGFARRIHPMHLLF
jgi:hypothetical protein